MQGPSGLWPAGLCLNIICCVRLVLSVPKCHELRTRGPKTCTVQSKPNLSHTVWLHVCLATHCLLKEMGPTVKYDVFAARLAVARNGCLKDAPMSCIYTGRSSGTLPAYVQNAYFCKTSVFSHVFGHAAGGGSSGEGVGGEVNLSPNQVV